LFFGSTAGRVLRTAQFPVLAVPPPARRGAGGPPPKWPHTVLAGVEIGSHAARDVRRVTDLARALGAALRLVTVVPSVQTPPWLRFRASPRDHQRIVNARTRLSALARSAGRSVTFHALLGDPADQLSAAAADMSAGLIVLLLHPADRPFGTRQGSVTYRVLCRSSVPVLALSPRRRA
jgi:nucleotide-binding universal stress UspA family protein